MVALVTLRKGPGPGAWLLLWGLLPAGTLAYVVGDSGPLALLLGTALLAGVLRLTVSLPLAVLASVAVGALTGLGVMALGGAYLDQVVNYFGEFLAGPGTAVVPGWAAGRPDPSRRHPGGRDDGRGVGHDRRLVSAAGPLLAGGPI